MKTSIRPLIITGFTAGAALAAMPETAHAQIFVESVGSDSPTYPDVIGEYNFDGSPLNAALISGISGLHGPYTMAVSGGDIFLANNNTGTVAEYTTSGALVDATLISGLDEPWGITVSGGEIFVANTGSSTIGEYDLDGTPVNPSLVSGTAGAYDITVSGGDIFTANGTKVSEYTTSGALVATVLISLTHQTGIAVSGGEIFTANGNTIGEYNLNGTPINASLVSGLNTAMSIAVSGEDLYVPNGNAISEYTTSGTLVNTTLVTGLTGGLYGVDVVPVPEPSTLALAGFGGLSLFLFRRGRKPRCHAASGE